MNAMAQQKGLGRGLGALLGDYNQAPEGDGTRRLPRREGCGRRGILSPGTSRQA